MFYRMISKLLDYPDAALHAALPELRAALRQGFEAAEYLVLDRFLQTLAAMEPTEAQALYVQTFDLAPEHSLHLTHHLFGDDKNRGPALIDLGEFYKEYGLELVGAAGAAGQEEGGAGEDAAATNELPDYLPLMLEFADQLDAEEARMFLSQWGKVLNQLASNLEASQSAYAPLIRLIEKRSQLVEVAA
jgi:nitrate reductase delta subunit